MSLLAFYRECILMSSFQDVNIYFPERLARICNDMGVKNFLHVSALQQNLKHRSEWATTKVRENGLNEIINEIINEIPNG